MAIESYVYSQRFDSEIQMYMVVLTRGLFY